MSKIALVALLLMTAPALGQLRAPQPLVTIGGLTGPESAALDPSTDLLFVSNMGEGINPPNGTGFISVHTRDGRTLNKSFITGLNQPKGIKVAGNVIFIAETTAVVTARFNYNGRSQAPVTFGPIVRTPIPGAELLNDLDLDAAGNLYVTDTFGNQIFRVSNAFQPQASSRFVALFLKDDGLESPNGIVVKGNRFFISNTDPETSRTKSFAKKQKEGHVQVYDLVSRRRLFAFGPAGGYDGIALDDEGRVLAADFGSGRIFRFDPNRPVLPGQPILQIPPHPVRGTPENPMNNPAEIFFDPIEGQLVVVVLTASEVRYYKYSELPR
jgi:DNA-binding beta-propeller fold protein YncE